MKLFSTTARRPFLGTLAPLAPTLGRNSRCAGRDRGTAGAPSPAPPAVEVLVAAHDLSGLVPLTDADTVARSIPAAVVPDGALAPGDPVAGRALRSPVRAGYSTEVRLRTPYRSKNLPRSRNRSKTGAAARFRKTDQPRRQAGTARRSSQADVGSLRVEGDRAFIYLPWPQQGCHRDPDDEGRRQLEGRRPEWHPLELKTGEGASGA